MGDTMVYAGVRMGYKDERKICGTAEGDDRYRGRQPDSCISGAKQT